MHEVVKLLEEAEPIPASKLKKALKRFNQLMDAATLKFKNDQAKTEILARKAIIDNDSNT